MKTLMFVGVTGSGKSSLFTRLRKSMEQLDFNSTLVLTSFYTQNLVNYMKVENRKASYLRLLEEHLQVLESLQRLERLPEPPREIGVLLEMFLFNATFEYDLELDHFQRYEDRLIELGGKVVFLKMREDLMEERCVTSTRRVRGEKWAKYLDGFDKSDAEIADMFLQRQRKFEEMVNKTRLDKLVIDTSEMDWDHYEQQILNYWKG